MEAAREGAALEHAVPRPPGTLPGQPRCRGEEPAEAEQAVKASRGRWELAGAFGSRRCSVLLLLLLRPDTPQSIKP